MAGGGVGEAALLETVLAAEAAGAVAGGAELAGGLGSLVGAGELAGLTGAGAAGGFGALEGAGLAAESGGLPSILQNTAALNPDVAAATQSAMQPGVLQATNFAQPGAVQPTNIPQMMGNPGVELAGNTPQAAVNAAAQAVAPPGAPPVDPNIAASMANAQAGIDQAGAASLYPPPGGAKPDVLDQLGKLYDKIPTPAKYGLGAISAIKALNALDGNKYGTPGKEEYTGPLSKFKYDPARYTPTIAKPNVYRPSYAGGGLADLGGYADYAGGGRMLKGPGDGMSDSIPATIAGKQPARLANDEFVVPADVVSHLGNGSSDAGAKQLYKMMDKVRAARTGKKSQAKQINPNKYMPA